MQITKIIRSYLGWRILMTIGSKAVGIVTSNLYTYAQTGYMPDGSDRFAPTVNNDPSLHEKQPEIQPTQMENGL